MVEVVDFNDYAYFGQWRYTPQIPGRHTEANANETDGIPANDSANDLVRSTVTINAHEQ